jgi:hypothetical protein
MKSDGWAEFRRLEIQKAAQTLADAMVNHIDVMTTTCASCAHYDHNSEICRQFNAKPPCKVIVVGCEKFIGEIPF